MKYWIVIRIIDDVLVCISIIHVYSCTFRHKFQLFRYNYNIARLIINVPLNEHSTLCFSN